MTAGWRCIRADAQPGVVHVMPVDDEVDHSTSEDCACGPSGEHVPNAGGPDGWLITHHALDGRL